MIFKIHVGEGGGIFSSLQRIFTNMDKDGEQNSYDLAFISMRDSRNFMGVKI